MANIEMKQVYLAPMEGVTDYVYRNAFRTYFGGVDRYYTPFISPNETHKFTTREYKEIDPEYNDVDTTVPQLMTNQAQHFIWACDELKELGYQEVNLNLGCPSGTVVAKKKGSGFLAYPDELKRFLDQIFQRYQPQELGISIKTRIGKTSPEECYELMDIFNEFPIKELIIHPRIQKDFYKEPIRMEYFDICMKQSSNPVCYNGELRSKEDILGITERYDIPVMLGRGLIGRPSLAMEAKGIGAADLKSLKPFMNSMLEEYQSVLSGEKAVLCRMKEFWTFILPNITNGEKYQKRIRKAQRIVEYKAIVTELFTKETYDMIGE